MTIELDYLNGLLLISGNSVHQIEGIPELGISYDERYKKMIAPARKYRQIVLASQSQKIAIKDNVRKYAKEEIELKKNIIPRKHQIESLKAWEDGGQSGVVVLPTGAGKSILGVMAIARVKRPTLVIVPTIDLVHQWQKTLQDFFGEEIGTYGGGDKNLQRITVSTYDSARLIIESKSPMFGFIVFDECHHLPAPGNRMIAEAAIAPFRLGLTATIERSDGFEDYIYETVGPKVYNGLISEMVTIDLAPYDVINLEVPLSPEEWVKYTEARDKYLSFLRRSGVQIGSPGGWQKFIQVASRTPQGRQALAAHREQKSICNASVAKLDAIWSILSNHVSDRIILFTNDNAMAYKIGREFILPVITHHSKAAERKFFLTEFKEGRLNVLVTSRVLNEGIDVPEASVGVVVSGTGSVREHVQRLGRILRNKPGKRARLYEIVAADTAERGVNERRRQHAAYQGTH
jgi:superfamily II DNA or RNA helicase